MNKLISSIVIAVLLMNANCLLARNKEKMVQVDTPYGAIKIKLYDETPVHRDNFLKLVSDSFYTDLLFHRVIQHFMIQGGDPNSKTATPGQMLGSGDLGYTLPAEINPRFFHRRGVLAAARMGDQVNPEKRSSASQFYIMQGKVFRPSELDSLLPKMEEGRKMTMMQAKVKAMEPQLHQLRAEGKQAEIMARMSALRDSVTAEVAKMPALTFSEEQRKVYTTIGGYPSLDNNYTIYGEVIEGMEVVDSIAKQPVDQRNRPLQDIKFSIKLLK